MSYMLHTALAPLTRVGSPIDSGSRDGLRADHPGLVDHAQVGGVRAARQVAGQVGQPDADEYHVAVAQQPRRVDGHQFRGRIINAHAITS